MGTFNARILMKCDEEDNVRNCNEPLLDKELGIARRWDGSAAISIGDGHTAWKDLIPIADRQSDQEITDCKINDLRTDFSNIVDGSLRYAISKTDELEQRIEAIDDLQQKIYDFTGLPTFEEYRAMDAYDQIWSEPKCLCPECNHPMRRKEDIILTCFPPVYEYRCTKCNHSEYLTK